MGTFLNFVCPGVYIEQNAPRAVRSKARVWTERPARGAFYNKNLLLFFLVEGRLAASKPKTRKGAAEISSNQEALREGKGRERKRKKQR